MQVTKLLTILVLGLLLSGNANAVPVEFEILNHNINYLVKEQGYKITFVNNDDEGTVYYTLEKDNDVILCRVVISTKETECYKP